MRLLHIFSPARRLGTGILFVSSFASLMLLSSDLTGQIYKFTDDNSGAFNSIESNMTATAITRGAGVSAGDCVGASDGFGAEGWPSSTTFDILTQNGDGDYFEFSITPDASYQFVITGFKAKLRRVNPGTDADGPAAVRYAYSLDNGASWSEISSELAPNNNANCNNTGVNRKWGDFPSFKTFSKVIFRIYGYNSGNDGTGDLYLHTVQVDGLVEIPVYYRTRASGDWDDPTTWEISTDNISWIPAIDSPDDDDDNITVRNGHTVTVTTTVNVDDLTIESGGKVIVNANRTFRIQDGVGTDCVVSGTIENSHVVAVNGTLEFKSGSTYTHSRTGGQIPTAIWDPNSNCRITGVTSSNINPGSLGQTFGNFIWNTPLMSGNKPLANSNAMSVAGDMLIINTGTGELRINQTQLEVDGNFFQSGGTFVIAVNNTQTLAVAGNFVISGGTLVVNNSNSVIRIGTLKLGGNFTQTGGNITQLSNSVGLVSFSGNTPQAFLRSGGSVSNNVALEIQISSIVNFGTSIWPSTATGPFTLNAGGRVITANDDGFSTSGATGTIQCTGPRSYSSGANYTFEGASTGAFTTDPTPNSINNLTIDAPGGLIASLRHLR